MMKRLTVIESLGGAISPGNAQGRKRALGRFRKQIIFSFALLLIFNLSVCTRHVQAQSATSASAGESAPSLEFNATPVFRAGQYHIALDAGTLNVDTKYRVTVAVRNPTSETMVFRGVSTSCSCFNATASRLELDPGSEIELNFTAPVPKKMVRPDAYWRVRLEPKAKSDLGGIAIKVTYKVAGLLGFLDERVVLDVRSRKPTNEFRLPMILTKPVEAKNILVNLPEPFSDFKAVVVSENEQNYLSLRFSDEHLTSKYLAGEIGCMDSSTGIEDTLYCVIKKALGASVHPAILRAHQLENSPERLSMSAVVRVQSSSDSSADDKSGTPPKKLTAAIIDVTLDNKPLKINVKQLSSSVYRVKIALSENAVETMKQMKKPDVQWLIRTKEEIYKLRTAVSLPR